MCGIAGIVGGPKAQDTRLLARMAQLVEHRGPDDSGVFTGPGVGLAHRRLSILGVESSRQPMESPDGRFVIVFNGEIYNFAEIRKRLLENGHTFRTTGDTEVLLRLYAIDGMSCLHSLRGMFAFAIWDSKERTLFCARDRYGQKPLFYALENGAFCFASEIKAILPCLDQTPELDLGTLYHYMGLRYCPDDSTLFQGIRKLPPASLLWWKDGRIRVQRYWDIDYTKKLSGSAESIADELHEVLEDTVRVHLVSDVRVGTFLSGGVDSSLVTAVAAGMVNGKLPTFSLGSEAADFSELPFARQVSEQYGTEHHEEIVRPDLICSIPDLVWHMEEPGEPHGVGIFTLSRLARKQVKVVLGGDGGDEMFCGYTRYRGQQLLDWYTRVPAWVRRAVVGPIIRTVPESFSYYSLASKARWMNEASFLSGGERYYHSMAFFRFGDHQKKDLFTDDALRRVPDRNTAGKVTRFFDAPNADNLLDKMMYTDTMTRMAEHFLLIADRLSMAFGLELRVPLVDHKLAEFAARIPPGMKMNRRRQKHVLKLAGERYLSREFLDRTKRGFAYPMGRWFRNELKPLVTNVLADSRFARDGIFSGEYLGRLNKEHQRGAVDHSYRLWMLINLESWYRIFLEGQSPAQVGEWIASMTPTTGPTPR